MVCGSQKISSLTIPKYKTCEEQIRVGREIGFLDMRGDLRGKTEGKRKKGKSKGSMFYLFIYILIYLFIYIYDEYMYYVFQTY